MPRDLVVTRRTITRREKAGEGDSVQGKLRAALRHVASLTPSGYVDAIKRVNDPDIMLHVYKRVGLHGFSKCGSYEMHEMDPTTIEASILQSWGVGMYQLRPVYNERYYSPASVPFKISDGSEESESGAAPAGKDVEAVITETTRNLGNLAVARKFQELAKGSTEGDADMKDDRLIAILSAMKPDNTLLVEMMRQADERARRAEERSQQMLSMIMEQRQGAQAGALPLLGDLLKNVKPEVWQTLLNPAGPEPPGGWVDLIRELVGAVGPAIREIVPHVAPLLMQHLRASGVPARALADGSRQPNPQPAATPGAAEVGSGTMPIPLTEEQEISKGLIVSFLKENDMDNAFAALAAFPGMAPGPAGPMPMGDFIISRVDPAANPKVYLPQLIMLFPDLKTMLPAAEAFVRYIQNKIVKDEEAALAEERRTGTATEPAPTREGAQ